MKSDGVARAAAYRILPLKHEARGLGWWHEAGKER